ncbi:hypothetical protein [Bradyrhizobium sp. AUGA SZCCT0283]|uniref:hypothetical protein n=1 Tax=Bradyrhizobium sp. AUGA SZCCT0283 TaxID=2807671 RepID=UPI001BAB7B67|nr:hypothetical protein [Bradyrhizobium sp. AUGA SZCCT0283]MBR1276103.1 hypothetical protein [Bradyrhizobium sp. AUGA SZCCT0283]
MNPEQLEQRLGAAILRNAYLHSLLPKDLSEPLTADQLNTRLDTIELVEFEIMANTRAMQAMLEELKETADAQ